MTDGWVIWSRARRAWLRQDAMSWTHDRAETGEWPEAGADERADNLPLEDDVMTVPGRASE